MFFYPARMLLYELFCRVRRVKKVIAKSEHEAPGPEAEPEAGMEAGLEAEGGGAASTSLNGPNEDDADSEASDGPLIEGFPIDCGTKERKFLSMAKCKAVTALRRYGKLILC